MLEVITGILMTITASILGWIILQIINHEKRLVKVETKMDTKAVALNNQILRR